MTEVTVDDVEVKLRTVQIIVNRKTVRVDGRRATGFEIKEAAVAQGVRIELDFQLALVQGHERKIIGDADEVKLHEDQKFVATAADDNS